MGYVGGYIGEDVGASNLAARILGNLVLEAPSPVTKLAWVNDTSRRWEPEPIRWISTKVIQKIGNMADKQESITNRPSRFWGGLFDQFMVEGDWFPGKNEVNAKAN